MFDAGKFPVEFHREGNIYPLFAQAKGNSGNQPMMSFNILIISMLMDLLCEKNGGIGRSFATVPLGIGIVRIGTISS
jgi:hypothetical protein